MAVAILLVGEALTASARNWSRIIQNLLQIQESGILGTVTTSVSYGCFGEEHGGKMK